MSNGILRFVQISMKHLLYCRARNYGEGFLCVNSTSTKFCQNKTLKWVDCVAQSIRFLTTYECLTANQGVTHFILAWSHTFVEIDHETISAVILLHSAYLFKKGCCQLQVKVCAQSTG